MNVFELVMLVGVIAFAYTMGQFLGASYGICGWIVGVGVGALVPVLALHFLRRCYGPGSPLLPSCRQGKCRENDYRHLRETSEGNLFKCRCGDKYLLSGNQFMEVLSDGTTRAYMILRRPGGMWGGTWEVESPSCSRNDSPDESG